MHTFIYKSKCTTLCEKKAKYSRTNVAERDVWNKARLQSKYHKYLQSSFQIRLKLHTH